jgi:hypothetical protein
MEHEYTIVSVSRTLYFIRVFGSIFIGITLPLPFYIFFSIKPNEIVFIIIGLLSAYLLSVVTKKLYRGCLIIRFGGEFVEIENYIPLLRKKSKMTFKWSELKKFGFVDTQYFRILVVKDGNKKIHIAMDYDEAVDNFEYDLNRKLDELKELGILDIVKLPSIYERKIGLFIAILLLVLMVVWPIVIFINDAQFNIGLILVFYSGSLFYIYVVFKKQQSKILAYFS